MAAEAETAPHTLCFVRGQLPIPRHLTRCSYSDISYICKAIIYNPPHSVKASRKVAQFSRAIFIKNVWTSRRPLLDGPLKLCYFILIKQRGSLALTVCAGLSAGAAPLHGGVSGAPRGPSYLLIADRLGVLTTKPGVKCALFLFYEFFFGGKL